MSWLCSDSSCCSTGATLRRAKMSPGSSSTGMRLMVAVAAPVIMLVAPGPMEDVQANVCHPVLRLGEGRGDVDGGLFVAAQVVAEVRILLQRLSDAGDDAVSEDAPRTGKNGLSVRPAPRTGSSESRRGLAPWSCVVLP
jgi:hypothetical protein